MDFSIGESGSSLVTASSTGVWAARQRRPTPRSRIQRVLLFPGGEIAIGFEMDFRVGIGEAVGARAHPVRPVPGVAAEQDDAIGHWIGQLGERAVIENLEMIRAARTIWGFQVRERLIEIRGK